MCNPLLLFQESKYTDVLDMLVIKLSNYNSVCHVFVPSKSHNTEIFQTTPYPKCVRMATLRKSKEWKQNKLYRSIRIMQLNVLKLIRVRNLTLHRPWTQISLVSGPHGVPSMTLSLS